MAASVETIQAMAGFLGIDVATEPQLLWLAEKAVIAPLPPGWVEYEEGGVTYYADGEGEAAPTTYEHPNDTLFAQLVAAVRAGAFERCGWEIHWAAEGLPYFFHPPSTTTQWTIPEDVAVISCKSEPAPEPEPEQTVQHTDSDSGDEELVAKLHAQQARALKAKSRRAQAKGRRERERKQQHEEKQMRKIAAALKGTDSRYKADSLRLEGVNSSAKASELPPRSARSSASGSTAVSAQTDSADEAFVQKQLNQQRSRRTENMKERKPQEQRASRSERPACSDSTTVSAQTDSDDEAFVRAHRARHIEKRESQTITERKRVVKTAVGLAQQRQYTYSDHLEEPSTVQQQEPQGVATIDQEDAKETAVAVKEPAHESDDVLARAQSSAMTLRQLEQLADSPTPLGGSVIDGISAVTVVSPTVDATLLRALAHSESDSEEIVSSRMDEGDMEDMPPLSPRTVEEMEAERKRAVTRRRMFPIPAKDAQTARYGEQYRPQTAPAVSGNGAGSTRTYDKPWLQEAMIRKSAQTQRAQLREQRKQEWRQRERQQYKSDDDDPFGFNSCDSKSDDVDQDTGKERCSQNSRLVQVVDPDHLAILSVGSTMRRAKESYESELLRRHKEKEREEEEAHFDMVANDGHRADKFEFAALAKSQAVLPQKRARMEVAARPAVEWGGATARARAAVAAQEPAHSAASETDNASGKPRPTSAIARTQNHNQRAASAAADRLGAATVYETTKKAVTICDRTTADHLEVKRLVYDYPESVVQKQIAAEQRKQAARSAESARRRAERRVAETRGWLVPKSDEKGVEASEEARWRAAAVRREQKRARAQASVRLCDAMSMEKARLAAAAGQTLEQYEMSKQLEKVVQAEIEASPLQEVERLLRVIGIPPPELGQGGKKVRAPLLVDAICTGFIAGFNPLCGTPLAATALWDSIDRTFATDHARAVSAGRSRRNRVKQARAGVAARAAHGAATQCRPHQSGSAASVAQQSSDLQFYTAAERRTAFRREFGTHRPASAGPERARHLRAAANRRKPQDSWWPNTSQAFAGQRGGVDIPLPADQGMRYASSDGRRPRSAGVRRAQARRASVLREQGRSNAPRFDPTTGRVVVEAENLDLTPRWKNTFAEDENEADECQFGELMDAIQRKVEAAKRQMVKDQAFREDDLHSCTTVASDDAFHHVEHSTSH